MLNSLQQRICYSFELNLALEEDHAAMAAMADAIMGYLGTEFTLVAFHTVSKVTHDYDATLIGPGNVHTIVHRKKGEWVDCGGSENSPEIVSDLLYLWSQQSETVMHHEVRFADNHNLPEITLHGFETPYGRVVTFTQGDGMYNFNMSACFAEHGHKLELYFTEGLAEAGPLPQVGEWGKLYEDNGEYHGQDPR